MSQGPTEEERFAENVLLLSDAVIFASKHIYSVDAALAAERKIIDPNLAIFLGQMGRKLNAADQIEAFVKYTHQYWEHIRLKNKPFFLEHASKITVPLAFQPIQLSIFFDLITICDRSGRQILGADVESEIWGLFHNMVKISLKYVHRRRRAGPYAQEVDLEGNAARWNVRLR